MSLRVHARVRAANLFPASPAADRGAPRRDNSRANRPTVGSEQTCGGDDAFKLTSEETLVFPKHLSRDAARAS